MSELKPCPFCGGKAHLVVREDDGGYRATVYCTSGAETGCFTKMSHWALKKAWVTESATAAWNHRAQPTNEPLTLEQLREMDGEPVWVTHKDGSGGRWGIVNKYKGSGMCADLDAYTAYWFDDYCGTIAYEHKPEEVQQ